MIVKPAAARGFVNNSNWRTVDNICYFAHDLAS